MVKHKRACFYFCYFYGVTKILLWSFFAIISFFTSKCDDKINVLQKEWPQKKNIEKHYLHNIIIIPKIPLMTRIQQFIKYSTHPSDFSLFLFEPIQILKAIIWWHAYCTKSVKWACVESLHGEIIRTMH